MQILVDSLNTHLLGPWYYTEDGKSSPVLSKAVRIKKHHHHTFPIPFPRLANQFLCRIVGGRLLQQPAEDAAAEDIASHLRRHGYLDVPLGVSNLLGSMGLFLPTYKWGVLGWNNPLILTFDPNFLGHPSTLLGTNISNISLGINFRAPKIRLSKTEFIFAHSLMGM